MGKWDDLPPDLKWKAVRSSSFVVQNVTDPTEPIFEDGQLSNQVCPRCNIRMVSQRNFISRSCLVYLLPWEWGEWWEEDESGTKTRQEGLGAWLIDTVCPQGCVRYSLGGGMMPLDWFERGIEVDNPLYTGGNE